MMWCLRNSLSIGTDKVLQGVLSVVSGNRIDHVVAGECGGSVEAYQSCGARSRDTPGPS